ncbi:hypothetical protein ACH9EU_00920 [Kocuria sp. M1R5S2]|uniref:hypothetical protein n=1 Tax=Kocuria rhizosphaerae TaxID=3376285 RepID=UPI0037A21AFF
MREIQASREEQLARGLTLMAVALFVLSSAVLAFGAQAWGWAAALLAAAAVVGQATGTLGRGSRRTAAPARPAQDAARRTATRFRQRAHALR